MNAADADRDAALVERVARSLYWVGYAMSGSLLVLVGKEQPGDVDTTLEPTEEQLDYIWGRALPAHREAMLVLATYTLYGGSYGDADEETSH